MVEYSLDLNIPEHVWDNPVLQEMSKAVIDIMTWPNVRTPTAVTYGLAD